MSRKSLRRSRMSCPLLTKPSVTETSEVEIVPRRSIRLTGRHVEVYAALAECAEKQARAANLVEVIACHIYASEGKRKYGDAANESANAEQKYASTFAH
jgi:hypothetical protein